MDDTNRTATGLDLIWIDRASETVEAVEAAERRLRAVVYTRYSKLTESPDSIARQLERTRRYVGTTPLTIVREYEEPKATGTTLDNRTVLLQLIEDVERLNVGHVVIEKSDRLGRSFEVLARLWSMLTRKGVKIHDASRGGIMNVMDMGLSAAMAENDRGHILNNLQSGIKSSAARGRPMMAECYGYRFKLDEMGRRRFAVVEAEAEVVREIFRLFGEGVPVSSIAAIMNSREVDGARPVKWDSQRLVGAKTNGSGLLRRYRYTGVQIYGRTTTWVEDGVTKRRVRPSSEWIASEPVADLAIISMDVFNEAQRRLAAMSRRHAEERAKGMAADPRFGTAKRHPLQGIIRCERCGAGYSAVNKGNNRWESFCCNNGRNMKCSNTKGVARYRLEDAFVSLMRDELLSMERVGQFVVAYNEALSSEAGKSDRERRRIEKRLGEIGIQLEATFQSALTEGLTNEWLAGRRRDLGTEDRELREALANCSLPPHAIKALDRNEADVLLRAVEEMMGQNRIETGTAVGAEVLAALRRLVPAIFVDSQETQAFTMRVLLRPDRAASGKVDVRRMRTDAGPDVVVLSGSFVQPVKGFDASPRFAKMADEKALAGAHRLNDRQWSLIESLVPERVVSPRRHRGPTAQRRNVVEAAIFHLQTGTPLRRMPLCFGEPQVVFSALRRLEATGAWNLIEPLLRDDSPELFTDLRGTKMFPVVHTDRKTMVRVDAKHDAEVRRHALTDAEWALIEEFVPSKILRSSEGPDADGRLLLDGLVFRLKERRPLSRMPPQFGDADRFDDHVRRLVHHGFWDKIVARLDERSPSTLQGAHLRILEKYSRSTKDDQTSRLIYGRKKRADLIRRIDELFRNGKTYKEALREVGLCETTFYRWRRAARTDGWALGKPAQVG